MTLLLVLYSFVQAATEFLPVSSSGHLVLLHAALPIRGIDPLLFDLALHWGTLIAVITFFRKDLGRLVRGCVRSLRERQLNGNEDGRLGWYILAGSVVPILLGAVFAKNLEQSLRYPWVVATMLIVFGVILLLADRLGQRSKTLQQVTFLDALLIGASQVIAFVPGVSRSGISIITALSRNIHRVAAVRLSFLFSIPLIAAAGLGEALLLPAMPRGQELFTILTGILLTAVFGYLVIRFFLRFVEKRSMAVFAGYRFALAAGIILWLLF